MSWVRIWVHLVFSTKNHERFLKTGDLRKLVFQHMLRYAKEKDIYVDCINGYDDHAHCLISLGREQSISQVAHLLKGESSHWINKNKITSEKFNWQDDYWAVSVGEQHFKRLRKYIHQQEQHHGDVEESELMKEFEIQKREEFLITQGDFYSLKL
ncbi:MAG: transposase [Bacteroidota bacterium]